MRIFLVFAILLFALPAVAAENIYHIEKIAVKADAKTTDEAKAKAIGEGEQKAFDALVRRLTDYGYITEKPKVSSAQVSKTIENMEVRNEKITDKSYSAVLNFTFNPEKSAKLLNLKIIDNQPKGSRFLIIPVLVTKDDTEIWGHEWFKAWEGVKNSNILVPVGDLEDIKSLPIEELEDKNYYGADLLARRYKTPVVVIAEAQYITLFNSVKVTLRLLQATEVTEYEMDYPGAIGTGAHEMFISAAADIAQKLEKDDLPKDQSKTVDSEDGTYKRNYEIDEEDVIGMNKIEIMVSTPDLASWMRVRRKLLNTTMVKKLDVKHFSSEKTLLGIRFKGSIEEFKAALALQGIALEGEKETFLIKDTK